MTLAEQLRTKYALTSLKAKGSALVLRAISETLEAAAEIAEQENSPIAASRIRSLKWADSSMTPATVTAVLPRARTA